MTGFEYVGNELELFAHAVVWKRYWAGAIRRYLGTRIADIGAGMGTNLRLLGQARQEWTCVEPDAELAARISADLKTGMYPFACKVMVGTCVDLDKEAFDSLLYIDVLEHIEDDKAEVIAAAQRLRQGGHLIILSPAHQFLYSPFDAAIGHHRRYNRREMLRLTPATLKPICVRYLDSVGMMASLANRLLLKASLPSASEIQLWDRAMVPLSRLLDPVTGYRIGKTLLCVWRRL
jgi:2-polyprenyl-3-methyl-5-hydroxy-6-metoxy-1,4-benzoquinol methylase